MQNYTGQRDFKSSHAFYAGRERLKMNAIATAQQGAIDIEQVGVLSTPDKPRLNRDARFVVLFDCLHAWADLSALAKALARRSIH